MAKTNLLREQAWPQRRISQGATQIATHRESPAPQARLPPPWREPSPTSRTRSTAKAGRRTSFARYARPACPFRPLTCHRALPPNMIPSACCHRAHSCSPSQSLAVAVSSRRRSLSFAVASLLTVAASLSPSQSLLRPSQCLLAGAVSALSFAVASLLAVALFRRRNLFSSPSQSLLAVEVSSRRRSLFRRRISYRRRIIAVTCSRRPSQLIYQSRWWRGHSPCLSSPATLGWFGLNRPAVTPQQPQPQPQQPQPHPQSRGV